MLYLYKQIFSSFVKLSFWDDLASTIPDHDGNGTNLDDAIQSIIQDGRIDGEDKEAIAHVLDSIKNGREGITDEAMSQISVLLKPELEESLKLGYTVRNKASYEVYVRIMTHLYPNAKLPDYNTIDPKLMALWGNPSNYTFRYDQNNNPGIISVFPHEQDDSLGAVFSVASIDITTWEYKDDVSWGRDNFRNNNQLNLNASDMADIDQIIDDGTIVPEAEVVEPEPADDTIPFWERDEPLVETEPTDLFPEGATNPYDFLSWIWINPEGDEVAEEPTDEDSWYGDIIFEEDGYRYPEDDDEMAGWSYTLPDTIVTPEAETVAQYTVVSGDTMWAIVKKHYGLTSNREIAERVNAVVDAQPEWALKAQLQKDTHGNDGIKWDVLEIGDVIDLPDFSPELYEV